MHNLSEEIIASADSIARRLFDAVNSGDFDGKDYTEESLITAGFLVDAIVDRPSFDAERAVAQLRGAYAVLRHIAVFQGDGVLVICNELKTLAATLADMVAAEHAEARQRHDEWCAEQELAARGLQS